MSKSGELNIVKRCCAGLILLGSLFLMPWWVTAIVGFVFLFNFTMYVEFIILLLFLGPLYFDVSGHRVLAFSIPIIAVLLFMFVEFLKTRLSGYDV